MLLDLLRFFNVLCHKTTKLILKSALKKNTRGTNGGHLNLEILINQFIIT